MFRNLFGKRTKSVQISLYEFQILEWNTAMLSAIVNAKPEERAAVAEAVARQMEARKGAKK